MFKKIIIYLIVVGLIIFFWPKNAGGGGGIGGPSTSISYKCIGFRHSKSFSDAVMVTCYGIPYGKTCSISYGPRDIKNVACK